MTTHTQHLWRQPKGQPHIDAPCSETIDPHGNALPPRRTDPGLDKCSKRSYSLGNHRERISCLDGVAWITSPGTRMISSSALVDRSHNPERHRLGQGMARIPEISRFSPMLGISIYD
jgi:hypothetical protein